MAASHDQLPRDVNGIIQGAYRILHEDPTYHGEVGVFEIREGSSTVPACGRALQCALGEYGSRLFLEPWGPLPDGFLMPELIAPEVSPEVAAAFERCPWRETADAAKADEANDGDAGAATDELDGLTVDELREVATSLGLAPGNKQEKALRKLIRAARTETADAAKADEA